MCVPMYMLANKFIFKRYDKKNYVFVHAISVGRKISRKTQVVIKKMSYFINLLFFFSNLYDTGRKKL